MNISNYSSYYDIYPPSAHTRCKLVTQIQIVISKVKWQLQRVGCLWWISRQIMPQVSQNELIITFEGFVFMTRVFSKFFGALLSTTYDIINTSVEEDVLALERNRETDIMKRQLDIPSKTNDQ